MLQQLRINRFGLKDLTNLGQVTESTLGAIIEYPAHRLDQFDPHEVARRHEAIERLAMIGPPPTVPANAWEETVGMFGDDPIMQGILETGQRLRESGR